MGKNKKKKKSKDFWGDQLSAKDQMRCLDLLADIETGKKGGKKDKVKNIFGLSDVPVKDENGLPSGLMDVISKDMKKSEKKSNHDEYSEEEQLVIDVISGITPEVDDEEDEEEGTVEYPVPLPDIDKQEKPLRHVDFRTEFDVAMQEAIQQKVRPVRFDIIKELKRLEVSDKVVPVSLYVPTLKETAEIVYDEKDYDADTLGDDIALIFSYIISCKHPTAIFTVDEFVDFMENVLDYDNNKFIFMILDETYILAYMVEGREEFNNYLLDEMKYSVMETLKVYISIAYLVGTLHSAFYVEDTNYVTEYANSKFNQTEEFVDAFHHDEYTVIGHRKDDDEHDLIDVQELQTAARETISTIVGDDEFEYDEEYEGSLSEEEAQEDIDEQEEKIPESDVPNIESVQGEDIMKKMIQQNTIAPAGVTETTSKPEKEKSTTVITGNDSSSGEQPMILPVFK
jgi:hypothetical protein